MEIFFLLFNFLLTHNNTKFKHRWKGFKPLRRSKKTMKLRDKKQRKTYKFSSLSASPLWVVGGFGYWKLVGYEEKVKGGGGGRRRRLLLIWWFVGEEREYINGHALRMRRPSDPTPTANYLTYKHTHSYTFSLFNWSASPF